MMDADDISNKENGFIYEYIWNFIIMMPSRKTILITVSCQPREKFKQILTEDNVKGNPALWKKIIQFLYNFCINPYKNYIGFVIFRIKITIQFL